MADRGITVGFNRRNKSNNRDLALATSKIMWLKPIIIVQNEVNGNKQSNLEQFSALSVIDTMFIN